MNKLTTIMKTSTKSIIFHLLGLLLIIQTARAQNNLPEQIHSFTDRNIYIVGEKINFSSIITFANGEIKIKSKVLYCDIISSKAEKVTGDKFFIKNSSASGTITIPNNIKTGYYYLRSYTKLMRNYNHSNFAYILLKIINPNNKQVLQAKKIQPNYNDSTISATTYNSDIIQITTNKKTYKTRDSIFIKIKHTIASQTIKHLTISIVPEHSIYLNQLESPTSYNPKQQNYYPETRGISVTGKLIDKNHQVPLSNYNIYLSIVQLKEMIPNRTNSLGRFFFSLPKQLKTENIILSTELKNQKTKPVFLIDNDFEITPDDIAFPSFQMSKKETELVYKMAINKQLETNYFPIKEDTDSLKTAPISFYGVPSYIFKLDDYIPMPALSDYFTEIDSYIKIIKNNGKKEFRIRETKAGLLKYKPLIMLDWVVVQDAEDILALSPKTISHVEIINSDYLRGNFIFKGILNFISKNNDFGGIEFSNTTISFPFQFFSKSNANSFSPKCTGKNTPDLRNTLLWNTNVNIANQETKIIKTRLADMSGKYIIVVRGLNSDGQTIQSTAKFEVN